VGFHVSSDSLDETEVNIMAVFEIEFAADNYQMLVPVDEQDYDGSNLWATGERKLSSWKAPEMRWSAKESSSESIPDITRINPALYAFNERATQVLGPLLSEYGELLLLPVGGEVWSVFNPTNVVDCLDQEKSEWRIKRSGEKGRLIKATLNENKIGDEVVFQIPEKAKSSLFCSNRLLKLVSDNQLTGLNFNPI
jgi:hypothetical protein